MAIIIGFISEVMVVIYVPNCMYNPYCAPQVQRERKRERESDLGHVFRERNLDAYSTGFLSPELGNVPSTSKYYPLSLMRSIINSN